MVKTGQTLILAIITFCSISLDWMGLERRFTPPKKHLLLTIPKRGVSYMYIKNWLRYAVLKLVYFFITHTFQHYVFYYCWFQYISRINKNFLVYFENTTQNVHSLRYCCFWIFSEIFKIARDIELWNVSKLKKHPV